MRSVGPWGNGGSVWRFLRRNAAGLVALAALCVVTGLGCSPTKPTELVPGVMTQVQVPVDLQAIQVEVDADGRVIFCQSYDVYNGAVDLPATLGVISGSAPDTTVKVTIRGYDEVGASMMNYQTCPDPTPMGSSGAPRVLRSSVQTFVAQHVLFLPMALSYSCFDDDCSAPGSCGAGTTDCVCKGNQCVTAQTDATKLADFDPALIDGTGVCFDASACFAAAASSDVVPADPDNCIYDVPVPAGAAINVRVVYQDVQWVPQASTGGFVKNLVNASESEILNEDPVEGFCLGTCPPSGTATDDGGAPAASLGADAGTVDGIPLLRFQLPAGLCKLVKASSAPPPAPATGAPTADAGAPAGPTTIHSISEVQVGLGCTTSKSPLLPFCAATSEAGSSSTSSLGETPDGQACNVRVPLTSTPSAVYMVMDDSEVMNGAFGATGYATIMSLSLSNPIFDETYAGFRFFPERNLGNGVFDQSECTDPPTLADGGTDPNAFSTPAVPFGAAAAVKPAIAQQVMSWTAPGDTMTAPAPLDLQAALRSDAFGAYTPLRAFLTGRESTNVAAVMVFLNRAPDTTNDCNPPIDGTDVKSSIEAEIQAAYNATPSIRTYFVVLGNIYLPADAGVASDPLAFYNSIAADLPQMATVIDATATDATTVLKNFAQNTEQLGTCLYDSVTGVDKLDYSNPLAPTAAPTTIPPNAACNASTQQSVNGWSIDNGRIRICGSPCTDLQNTVLAATASAQAAEESEAGVLTTSEAAQATAQPIPRVTVTGTILCNGTAPISDGGPTTSAVEAGAKAGDAATQDSATGTTVGGSSAPDATVDASGSDATVDASGGDTAIDASGSDAADDAATP